MGRKERDVTITEPKDSRDYGKTFFIREMPSSQAEKWAMRALLLAVQAGVDVPRNIIGMAGIALIGIQTVVNGVRFSEIEPLLDEMFRCIEIKPDPKNPMYHRPLVEEDIDDVGTRIKLREAVLDLHLGFSLADALSDLTSRTPAAPPPESSNTQTSSQHSAS